MSNTANPEDAASVLQAESTEEELAHEMSNGDCQVCRSLRLPVLESITTTYAELQRATVDACELCELLQRVSETACIAGNTVIQNTDEVSVFPGILADEYNAARLKVFRNTGDRDSYEVLFYTSSGGSCHWPFMTSNHMPDENASIQDCARSINRMLDKCNNRHTSTCSVVGSRQQIWENLETPRFIPKRLLHIRRVNKFLQVRLRETARNGASLKEIGIKYTALSHCWGSTPIIKTITARVSSFETDGINWVSLPKTFQEAIMLTHELGVDYIWIDSLCILQDSVEDWAHQASQMADIFSNAYLTIGASASQNGHQGLLNRRHTTRKIEAVHNNSPFSVSIRDSIQHEFIDPGGFPFLTTSYTQLRKRAWCFQEELLSVRMIHFTEDEVVFVCRTATICECNSSWMPRFQIPPIVGTGVHDPSQIWENTVEHYTERQISFCKDRLPALSSFTHYFQQGSDCYHAGLWESHMPGNLLWWSQCGTRPEQEQSSQSRPPSWSWASIEGMVGHSDLTKNQKIVAEVLDVRTYPSTVDPRGMVSGGQVTLRAPFFPLRGTWKKHETSWQSVLKYHTGSGNFDSCFACSPGWAPKLQWSDSDHCYCVLDDPANPLLLLPNRVIDTPIYLLVVRTFDTRVMEYADAFPYPRGFCLLGLLLQPLEDLDQIQTKTMAESESKLPFMRIGFGAMCLSEEEGEEALHRFGNTTVTIF